MLLSPEEEPTKDALRTREHNATQVLRKPGILSSFAEKLGTNQFWCKDDDDDDDDDEDDDVEIDDHTLWLFLCKNIAVLLM